MGSAASQPRGQIRSAALAQGGALLVGALVLGCVLWAARPDRLPWRADLKLYDLELEAPVVDVAQASELYDLGDHLFIDTRAGVRAGGSIVPGAFFLRAETFADDLFGLFDYLGPETPLLLYGDGDPTKDSYIARMLRERGYTQVSILAGGFPAWVDAGGPTSTWTGAAEP